MNPDEPDLQREVIADCATVLRICDLARPGDADPRLLSLAMGHLEYCSNCRQVVRERERFDARVAALCREIAPPVNGRERLMQWLATVADAASADASAVCSQPPESNTRGVSESASTASTPVPRELSIGGPSPAVETNPRPSRRRALQAAVAALLLLAATGMPLWLDQFPSTNVERILTAIGTIDWKDSRLPEIVRLQNGEFVRLPEEMKTSAIHGSPRQLSVDRVQTAVFFFQFSRQGARRVQAALAAVPVSQLSSAPSQRRFLAKVPLVLGDLCATTWVEGNTAYVCCVRGTPSDLQELALPRPAA